MRSIESGRMHILSAARAMSDMKMGHKHGVRRGRADLCEIAHDGSCQVLPVEGLSLVLLGGDW